jgi:hypothetical protein
MALQRAGQPLRFPAAEVAPRVPLPKPGSGRSVGVLVPLGRTFAGAGEARGDPFFCRCATVRRKRYDSVPVSMICARSVRPSSRALQRRALGNTDVHSEKGRLVVAMSAAFSARSAMSWKSSSAPTSASATLANRGQPEFGLGRAHGCPSARARPTSNWS